MLSVSASATFSNQKTTSAAVFLNDAIAYYNSLGSTVTCVMTDNGSCHKTFGFRDSFEHLGMHHICTRPCFQWTKGKIQCFNKTIITEQANTKYYSSSDQRAATFAKSTHCTTGAAHMAA